MIVSPWALDFNCIRFYYIIIATFLHYCNNLIHLFLKSFVITWTWGCIIIHHVGIIRLWKIIPYENGAINQLTIENVTIQTYFHISSLLLDLDSDTGCLRGRVSCEVRWSVRTQSLTSTYLRDTHTRGWRRGRRWVWPASCRWSATPPALGWILVHHLSAGFHRTLLCTETSM